MLLHQESLEYRETTSPNLKDTMIRFFNNGWLNIALVNEVG